MKRNFFRWRIVVFLLTLVCGPAASAALAQSAPAAPGTLIDLGGYKVHLNCSGKAGRQTVVLISGSGDYSFDWFLVQSKVSETARVCSYDRPGTGWSDLGPTPRTMRQEAYELNEMLARTGIKTPIVLVGHSIGGLIARQYFDMYPRQVDGMILVDPTTEDTKLNYQGKVVRIRDRASTRPVPEVQTMRSSPPKPPTEDDKKQAEFNRQVFGPPKISPPFDKLPKDTQTTRLWFLENPKLSSATENFWAEELQSMHISRQKQPHPLGSVALSIIIPELTSPVPLGISASDWAELSEEKKRQKTELAGLSSKGHIVWASKSGHHIQLDEPDVVVGEIVRILKMTRKGN